MSYSRRTFLASGLALVPLAAAFAQSGHDHHGGLYESLRQPGRIDKPEVTAAQHVFDSPTPKAANPGRWMAKTPLPLPRSEMAWATECAGRLHLVGGYAEQRVDRPYHHVYDPAGDRWTEAAPLPRGANHVGVACMDGRIYAIGGFIEQNRRLHNECFVYDTRADRWQQIASLPTASERWRSATPYTWPEAARSWVAASRVPCTRPLPSAELECGNAPLPKDTHNET